MSCGCGSNPQLYRVPCEEQPVTTLGCLNIIDSTCVEYKGDTLTCTGIEPGTRLENILQVFDQKLCGVSTSTDYSTFNYYCLDDTVPIQTEKQFVEKISSYVCTLNTNLNTFVGTTFEAYKSAIQNQLASISNPNVPSCLVSRYGASTMTLQGLINNFGSDICTLFTRTSMSGINWTQCFGVSPIPSTVAQGFTTVLDMICQVKTLAQGAGTDTYKVKTTAGDSNPDYLFSKLKSTSCTTWSTLTDTDGKEKISLSIPMIYNFTFDNSQFNVTPISTGACLTEKLVSIKPEILNGSAPTVNCATMQTIFSSSGSSMTSNNYLYGTNSSSGACERYDRCAVLNWLFGSANTGLYNISVNQNQSGCSRVTLSPATSSTPGNAGWNNVWNTLAFDGNGTADNEEDHTWETYGFGWDGADANNHNLPSYRFNFDGDLEFRGSFKVELITNGDSPKMDTFTMQMGTIPPSLLVPGGKNRTYPIATYIAQDTNNGIMDGMIYCELRLNGTSGNLSMFFKFRIGAGVFDTKTMINLDGIAFHTT